MSDGSRRQHSSGGFTLVELLVVLVILSIIGAIVTSSLTRGFRADAEARTRIQALEQMQVALERVSRDIRPANPILPLDEGDDNAVLGEAISVRINRGDECFHHTFKVDGENLVATVQRSTDGCVNLDTGTSQVLLEGLDPAAEPFEYVNETLGPATGIGDTASVRITFERTLELGQRPIEVSTLVGLRNRQ